MSLKEHHIKCESIYKKIFKDFKKIPKSEWKNVVQIYTRIDVFMFMYDVLTQTVPSKFDDNFFLTLRIFSIVFHLTQH